MPKGKKGSGAGRNAEVAPGSIGKRRRERKPAQGTIDKQLWVIDKLKENPNLSVNELMQAVRENHPKMLSFDRTKEARAAFEAGPEAIEKLKNGTFQSPIGKGGRAASRPGAAISAETPKYIVASKNRSRWAFDPVSNMSELKAKIRYLLSQGHTVAVYGEEKVKYDFEIKIGR